MPQPSATNNISEQFLTEHVSIGWPWRILLFAIVIFALSLLIYFGLRFGYGPYLDSRSETLDRNLAELTQGVNLEDQERFVNFYSQLVNLKTVLEKHPFPSNTFSFLERNTLGRVYFSRADLDVGQRTLRLKGFAASIQGLAEQIAVLENSTDVDSVLVEDVGLSGGGTAFSASLTFKPEFFTKSP